MIKTIDIHIGDCREVLKTLPDKSVHCCVTSPPYFGLRRYCQENSEESKYEIGLEQTPEEYIIKLVEIFRDVKRVLRDDGSCWIIIADSYSSKTKGSGGKGKSTLGPNRDLQNIEFQKFKPIKLNCGLQDKQLIGIPFRLAFALQADGWWWRDDIIWSKGNAMPSSVSDRTTTAHEHILLFTKSKRYYFDSEAIKEPAVSNHSSGNGFKRDCRLSYQNKDGSSRGNDEQWDVQEKRNKRSVWNINTVAYSSAHFATFPISLVDPCLKAGTSEHGVCSECGRPYTRITEKTGHTEHGGLRKRADAPGAEVSQSSVFRTGLITTTQTVGWQPLCSCNASIIPATVLDPFGGSGTVGQWCQWNNRNAILIELNPEYRKLIEERINTPPKTKKPKKSRPYEKFAIQQNLGQFLS